MHVWRNRLGPSWTALTRAAPNKKKAPVADSRQSGAQVDKLNELYLSCVEPPVPDSTPPMDAERLEEGTRLAKEYTRRMWQRHKIQEADYQRKITLKFRAIHALPTEELRREALTVSEASAPLLRPLATDTPPTRGFHWREFEEDIEDDDDGLFDDVVDDSE